jgi:hypothetical protein
VCEKVRVTAYDDVVNQVGTTPAEIEGMLRPLLRDVRLVGELDLALEGDVYLAPRMPAGR